jgi:ribosomal protein S18 acetylase RimI-like enzyme
MVVATIAGAIDRLRSCGFTHAGLWVLDTNQRALRFYHQEPARRSAKGRQDGADLLDQPVQGSGRLRIRASPDRYGTGYHGASAAVDIASNSCPIRSLSSPATWLGSRSDGEFRSKLL